MKRHTEKVSATALFVGSVFPLFDDGVQFVIDNENIVSVKSSYAKSVTRDGGIETHTADLSFTRLRLEEWGGCDGLTWSDVHTSLLSEWTGADFDYGTLTLGDVLLIVRILAYRSAGLPISIPPDMMRQFPEEVRHADMMFNG